MVPFIHTYLTCGPDLTYCICVSDLIQSTRGPVQICVLFLHILLVVLFIHTYLNSGLVHTLLVVLFIHAYINSGPVLTYTTSGSVHTYVPN